MVVSDIASRLQYFGTHQLYFQAITNDSIQTQSSKFYFNIDATDACRTATVNAQSITLPSVTLQVTSEDYPYSVQAFTDSLDATNLGICGAKQVTLDPLSSTAAFLTLSSAVDPVTFDYDMTKATAADIGIH